MVKIIGIALAIVLFVTAVAMTMLTISRLISGDEIGQAIGNAWKQLKEFVFGKASSEVLEFPFCNKYIEWEV